MRPILLACMTQAPWRHLGNKSNPLHLRAVYSVSQGPSQSALTTSSKRASRSEALREVTFPVHPDGHSLRASQPALGVVTFRKLILGSHSASAWRARTAHSKARTRFMGAEGHRIYYCCTGVLEALGKTNPDPAGLSISGPNYSIHLNLPSSHQSAPTHSQMLPPS